MRTRCPACSTTFRVTSEQLRLKAGKVRCGQCLAVFNAFDALIEEDASQAEAIPSQTSTIPATAPIQKQPPPVVVNGPNSPSEAPEVTFDKIDVTNTSKETEPFPQESIAESTQAARDAGLVAARELAETSAYNRWAAGTLAGNTHGHFETEQPSQASWPFLLATIILGLLLAAQFLFYFRTAIVQRLPDLAGLYTLAAVDVPLPTNSDLVGIDVSDLQSDNARGLLILQATLRNRALFAQAWPALELTLTDTQDTVISRRILQANEYLPPGTDTQTFPARSDMSIRLWLEAKGVGAAGYRLYLFYP